MNDMNRIKHRPRRAHRPAVLLAASALLLCALPAGAGLSGAIGAGGAGHSLKETLAETADNFSELVGAFIDGDEDRVSELAGEISKMPGKLIKRAFPVLEAPQAIADRLTAARHKVERFAGGVKQGLVDARAALAVAGNDESGGWREAMLLEGDPLPAPPDTAFAASNLKALPASPTTLTGTIGQNATGNPADSWDFEAWVIAKQDANPHCYGVVDPETLPPECFGGASAEKPAASPADNKAADPPQAKGFDWAADDWHVDGDGTSVWDLADDRYKDADRDAARVGVFAADCWGVHGVSRESGLYELMRERMQSNDCPNEDTQQAGAASSGENDYLSALGDLEAQEAARRRLEEEERQRQARLAAEERERQSRQEQEEREQQAQREQERRRQRAERQERLDEMYRQDAEYRRQALQNVTESLRGFAEHYTEQVNRSLGGGGTPGTTTGAAGGCSLEDSLDESHTRCKFDYNKRP